MHIGSGRMDSAVSDIKRLNWLARGLLLLSLARPATASTPANTIASLAAVATPGPSPLPPSPPLPPPSQLTTIFDFSGGIATGLGWSTGGGSPTTSPYAFTKLVGSTPSNWARTGPSAGVGGSGSYVYTETSSPRVQGDLFTLGYDGSSCSDIDEGVSTVAFQYHMYG